MDSASSNVNTEEQGQGYEGVVVGEQENIETGNEERREVGVQEIIETGNEERREGVVDGEQQNHVEAALQGNERDL